MLTIIPRLFLLALLACDWAGDPCFGRSLLSASYSSTPVSRSVVLNSTESVRRAVDLTGHQVAAANETYRVSSCAGNVPDATLQSRQSTNPGRLIYLFMVIQR